MLFSHTDRVNNMYDRGFRFITLEMMPPPFSRTGAYTERVLQIYYNSKPKAWSSRTCPICDRYCHYLYTDYTRILWSCGDRTQLYWHFSSSRMQLRSSQTSHIFHMTSSLTQMLMTPKCLSFTWFAVPRYGTPGWCRTWQPHLCRDQEHNNLIFYARVI